MAGGRRKLPVLAEIAGPAPGESRAWSLRREDLEALARLQGSLGSDRAALVAGAQAPAAALGLAAAAGAAGRRTVLLECDLARPRLAADLGLAPAPGLHEYLRWEATAPQILRPLVFAGPASAVATEALVCIPGGRPAPDPATLIGLASFRHALAKLRAAYDLVVLAGPALEVGDGALELIAAEADAVLVAVGPEARRGAAKRRLRPALRRLPAPARGLLVVGG
jgi:polysaccharide biosynthesis transport protein